MFFQIKVKGFFEMIKYIVFGGVALAAGFALGYKIAVDRLEDKYANDLNEFMNKYKERMESIEKRVVAQKESKNRVYQNPEVTVLIEPEGVDENIEEDDEEDSEEDSDEDPFVLEDPDIDPNPISYLIQPNQYYYENTHYDKIELFFYQNDEVVCYGNDEKVEDDELQVIIPEITFFERLVEDTVIYIRNEKLRIDYTVTAMQASYKEDVLGRVETDRERDRRQKVRSKSNQPKTSKKKKGDSSSTTES